MNAPRGSGSSREPAAGRDAAGLIGTYVAALAGGDAETGLTTLSPDAVFCSPFNTWRSRHVPSVFRARSRAFDDLRIGSVIRADGQTMISWHATVGGAQVEGVELVSVGGGAICRVDVFLRPAGVLDAVHQAMVDAWPRSRP